jgi:hypothetical protein
LKDERECCAGINDAPNEEIRLEQKINITTGAKSLDYLPELMLAP